VAQPEWTDRPIRAPDADWLEPDELRKLFPGMSQEWFNARVKDGTIPPPIRFNARSLLYTWEHAAYLALWLKFFGSGEDEPAKKDSPS
jgi:hypothetical protein